MTKTSYIIPLSILFGGLIVAIAVYASFRQPQTGSGNGNPALVRPVDASDHIFGNPAARAVIIEYSDFDCQYCKFFHETLHQIIANEGARGEVAWVFRHFPLTEIHKNALSHAKAAECAAQAGGNEAFWKFADALYANQPADPSRYGTLAAQVDLKTEAFATCYSSEPASKPLVDRIMADRQNALQIGAAGTPFSILLVAGKPPVVMDGAYSYDAVRQLLDEALIGTN